MNTTGKTCARCFFGESIDMAENRYKCHVSRPTANAGFPKVRATDFCSYWTDPKTMDRPFFYLLPYTTDLYKPRPKPTEEKENNETRPQDNAGGV